MFTYYPSIAWPVVLEVRKRDGRFVIGQYRRHMKAITYLGALDRVFGVPATTRNWNTMTAIAKVLSSAATRGHGER